MKLLDWIDVDQVDWERLHFNKNAFYLLEQNPERIKWVNISYYHDKLLYLYDNQPLEWWYTVSILCKDTRFLLKHKEKLFDIWSNPYAIPIIRDILLDANTLKHINWERISLNKSLDVIPLFEQNLNKIDYDALSRTDNAIIMIENHPELLNKFNWKDISKNPKAIYILEKYPNRIVWDYLCMNKNAIYLLKQNPNRINWNLICSNINALPLLYLCPDVNLLDWHVLSRNKGVIPFIENHLDMVIWYELSSNKNAIHILEKYPEKINWYKLSSNKNAIPLLEKNRDKIVWDQFYVNYSIFRYDYKKIKEIFINSYGEELINTLLHPDNYHKFKEWKL